MNKFGGWYVEVDHNQLPKSIESAMNNLKNTLLGCSYEFIAYLGYQQVNGTNHAVLAQQTVLNGKDTNNAVIIVFNEKNYISDISVTDIKRIVESGGELGGTTIAMSAELPEIAEDALAESATYSLGTSIKPIAYVGSKVTTGTEQIIIASATPMTLHGKPELVIMSINTMKKRVDVERLFELGSNDVEDEETFSYAVNWLKKSSV